MNDMRRLILAWGLAAWVAPAVAQTAPTPTFTVARNLAEAVNIAIDNRIEIRIAAARAEGLQARVRQALSRYYPSLDVGLTADRVLNYDVFTGITGQVTIAGQTATINVERTVPRYTVIPSVRLSYDLFTGWRDSAVLEGSKADLRGGEAEALIVSRDVVKDVALAYLQLRRAAQQLETAKIWVDHYVKREAAAKTRLSEGQLSDIDYRIERLAVAEREIEVRKLEREVQARVEDYTVALGNPEPSRLPGGRAAPGFGADLDAEIDSIAKWADGTLEINKTQADVEAAQFRIRSEQGSHYPQIKWYVQYAEVGRSDADVLNAFGNLRRRDYSLGFTVAYNLFSGFNTSARVAEALADSTRLSLQLTKTSKSLEHATQKLRSALERDSAALSLAEQRREIAQLKLTAAEQRFAGGLVPKTYVEQASMEALDASRAVDIAKLDRSIARFRLTFASIADAP
jgi:outer membrane protein TolC